MYFVLRTWKYLTKAKGRGTAGIRKSGAENWDLVSSTGVPSFSPESHFPLVSFTLYTNLVASESPGGLVEVQIAELPSRVSKSLEGA